MAGHENLEDPVFLLHAGAEYHIGINVIHHPDGQRLPIKRAAWIRIAPVDGRALTLDVTREENEGKKSYG